MRIILVVLSFLLAAIVIPTTLSYSRLGGSKAVTSIVINENSSKTDTTVPSTGDITEEKELKVVGVSRTLVLEARNTVVLRGPVTIDSVAKTMLELKAASRRLDKSTPIYLVLDTPGGSVSDGLDLIDFANALPQKIHTVTLFAASMGFQIAQNLDRRYIIRSGTLMSHRAALGGLGGQMKGELESRYRMLRRWVDYLDYQAAKRMEMDVKAYEAMIVNEYWVHGYDAVQEKAADEQVLVRCGESLNGTDKVTFQTLFGSISATISKCPLVKGAIDVDASEILNKDEAKRATDILTMSFEDKRSFVREYISTGKFGEIFN